MPVWFYSIPVVGANGLDDNLPGSVGRPLKGIDVKLTAEGELLVHSPSNMTGYWKDDAETERALGPTGWLSTGDLAEIEDGRIFIRGRLKETIVLSIGEKVNPNIVEAALNRDPLFRQAVVVGDRRPFLAAIIVLHSDIWKRFAADNGLDPALPNHPSQQDQSRRQDYTTSRSAAEIYASSRRISNPAAVDD